MSALAAEHGGLFELTQDDRVRRALHEHVKTIYGLGSPRGNWCFQIAAALLAGDPIPKPPGRPHHGVPERIIRVVTDLLREEGLLS